MTVLGFTERRLLDLLKQVQNRQYDDQRGTSLTAFKEMPNFLRESSGDDVERLITDKEFGEKCALDESQIEVCRRRRDTDADSSLHLSASPAWCLQQTAAFSDEDEIPSHENAERYFSCGSRVEQSPDYSNPKLMEKSLRDIGMESPASGASHCRTLVGSVADNRRVMSPPTERTNDDVVFAVPTMPPLRIYRRRASVPLSATATDSPVPTFESVAEHWANQPPSADTCAGQSERSSSTPSPTTHDLVLVGGECVVSKASEISPTAHHHALAPIVDPEDSGEEYGIV